MRTEWPVGRWRLLKLAEHLESGTLGHANFDFRVSNIGETDKKGCGSTGCALGELPILFPKQWRFQAGCVILRIDSTGDLFHDSAAFFGIDLIDAERLFIPGVLCLWNDAVLYGKASRYDVAASIRQFVPWKDKRISA